MSQFTEAPKTENFLPEPSEMERGLAQLDDDQVVVLSLISSIHLIDDLQINPRAIEEQGILKRWVTGKHKTDKTLELEQSIATHNTEVKDLYRDLLQSTIAKDWDGVVTQLVKYENR